MEMGRAVLLLGLGTLFPISGSAQWPMFKYDKSRTGIFLSDSGNITSPQVKWQKQLDALPSNAGDHIHCSPAIGDVNGDGELEIIIGIEEAGDNGGGIWCLQATNGNQCWFKYLDAYIHNSSPALGDVDQDGKLEIIIGTGFSGSTLGVYAFNGEDGSVLWFHNTGGVESSPNIGDIDNDGKLEVIVGVSNGNLYALNGEDGSELWVYPTGYGNVRCSPTLADINGDDTLEVIFQTTTTAKLVCLHGPTGVLIWSYHIGTGFSGWGKAISTPAIGDINQDGSLEIVVGACNGTVHAVNSNGSPIWVFGPTGPIFSSPSIGDIDGDGMLEIVIGSNDAVVYALNGEDGSLLWSYNVDNHVESTPVLTDIDGDGKLEVVVNSFANYQGPPDYLYVINGEDGSLCWDWQFPNLSDHVPGSPAASDIDNDGEIEIVIGSGGHTTEKAFIYVIDKEGSGTEESKNRIIQKILLSNYSNPFKSHIEFSFKLFEAGEVTLIIYNLAGERVRNLVEDKHYDSGICNLLWNGEDGSGKKVAPGVYIYAFEVKNNNGNITLRVNKIIKLK